MWSRVRQSAARPVSSRLAVVSVLAALAAPTVLALRAVSELDHLSSAPAFVAVRHPPSAHIESVVSTSAGTRIEGTAPAGTAIFLFSGGEFTAAAPAEKGRFRFDGLYAPGPYRVGALLLSSEPAAPEDSRLPTQQIPTVPMTSIGAHGQPAVPTPPTGREISFVPDFTRGPVDRRQIVVSFDGGSSDRGANRILDALARCRLRTTIFLTGGFIRRYPAVTRRIAADGHEVGNHTDSHPHLTTYASDGRQATRPDVDREFLARELETTARVFRQTTGRELAPIWRAPFGEQNPEIRRWAAEIGYWHVGWTGGRAGLDGLDWISDPRSRAYRSAGRVVERLLERSENGGIVLLHLGSDREDPVAPHVADLIDGLSRRGFELVRATELLDRAGLTERRLAALAAAGRASGP